MKNQNNEVWVGVDQLTNDPAYLKTVNQEFVELPIVEQLAQEENLDLGANRRDFLKYLGFGLGAATLAASCEIPVRKAIPYVTKPDTIVPGVAVYFASSFIQGGDYCPVLVKTREGRPIKIEGNSLSSITKGGTSARAQASVLSLYDTSRIDGPYHIKAGKIDRPVGKFGKGPDWKEIDKEIMGKLKPSDQIRIVSHTLLSPLTKQAIADFKAKFPNTVEVIYDPVSSSAQLEANGICFGEAVIPAYHFDKADVILAFEADFLGSWISPTEYASQYAKNRTIKDVKNAKMSRHIQVESHMSLTGSNADNRILVKPTEQGAAIVALYNELAVLSGQSKVAGPALDAEKAAKFKTLAKELFAAKQKALVVSASNNVGEQVLINAINTLLDSYGTTIDFNNASLQRQGSDKSIQGLIAEMQSGKVNAVFFLDGANPAWDIPNADKFRTALAKVKLKVSFSALPSETVALCDYATPTHHYLESWGDVEAKRGHFSLIQPTIAPLFKTRQAEETLLTWADSEKLNKKADQPVYEYLMATWQANHFAGSSFATFQSFWDSTLHDGVFEKGLPVRPEFGFGGDVNKAASQVRKPANKGMEISFFETVNMAGGQYANNPWLQEMPDPVARTVWGNYLAIPVKWEGGNRFKSLNNLNQDETYGNADKVEVTIGGKKQVITTVRQFGQMQETLGLALGYGREISGNAGRALGEQIGVNVYPWLSVDAQGNTQYYAVGVEVSNSIQVEKAFPCVQYHHSMGVTAKGKDGKLLTDASTGKPLNVDESALMALGTGYQGSIVNRSIIYKGHVNDVKEVVEHVEERRSEASHLNDQTLYPFKKYVDEHYSQSFWWAMHVDLNACIGCGACQVACISENNVPVVGKKEVARHHEMTWLRIDRYFFGDYENPNVVYQPMMCQHCDNAPCENVCPVAATNHSSEGLNQMTYNRCIGTRYCANNCPYKVRRFNWLDYTSADLFGANSPTVSGEEVPFTADNLTRMVLNPDVTVRSRGVIEKCSFCVQRLQEGKLLAKREGRRLGENDVKTACQTACPTGAIVFGDRNDKKSTVAKRMESPLNYLVLEEVNTMSSVNYSAKLINRDEKLDA
jgi:molybdopterin-containing oxidoreductase family iron-sulfur binding subunit